jgi:hypothetical protein
MKNSAFSAISNVLLKGLLTSFSVLALAACQPEDRGVTAKNTRLMIQNKNAAKKNKNFFQVGSFAMTSVTADQLIEAIEVARVALGYQTQSPLVMTEIGQNEMGDKLVNLKLEIKDQAYTTSQGDFVMSANKNWEAFVLASPEKGIFGAKALNSESSIQKQKTQAGKATLGTFKETESIIKLVQDTENTELLVLTYVTSGTLNATNNGASTSENFEITINVKIEKDDFASGDIDLKNATFETAFIKGEGRKPFVIKSSAAELDLHAEPFCHSLEGAITIDTDRSKKQLVLNNEKAEVTNSGYKSTLATCGKRPTVDFSRMLMK